MASESHNIVYVYLIHELTAALLSFGMDEELDMAETTEDRKLEEIV